MHTVSLPLEAVRPGHHILLEDDFWHLAIECATTDGFTDISVLTLDNEMILTNDLPSSTPIDVLVFSPDEQPHPLFSALSTWCIALAGTLARRQEEDLPNMVTFELDGPTMIVHILQPFTNDVQHFRCVFSADEQTWSVIDSTIVSSLLPKEEQAILVR